MGGKVSGVVRLLEPNCILPNEVGVRRCLLIADSLPPNVSKVSRTHAGGDLIARFPQHGVFLDQNGRGAPDNREINLSSAGRKSAGDAPP